MSGSFVREDFRWVGIIFIGEYQENIWGIVPMQDYKSPRVAAVIWTTLVNTQTHRQTVTDRQTHKLGTITY